jgi:hypothetical protein
MSAPHGVCVDVAGLFCEIVLIDSDAALAEAGDLRVRTLARPQSGREQPMRLRRGAVITAGATTPDETRLSVASKSAAIVVSCVKQLADGFDG